MGGKSILYDKVWVDGSKVWVVIGLYGTTVWVINGFHGKVWMESGLHGKV